MIDLIKYARTAIRVMCRQVVRNMEICFWVAPSFLVVTFFLMKPDTM